MPTYKAGSSPGPIEEMEAYLRELERLIGMLEQHRDRLRVKVAQMKAIVDGSNQGRPS